MMSSAVATAMRTSSSSTGLRALCLHGWRTNTTVMKYQVSFIKAALERRQQGRRVDFDYLNARHPAKGDTSADVKEMFGKGPYFEWWDREMSDDEQTVRYIGVEESLNYVSQYIEDHGPYDIIIGFSQGAALATLLCAQMQKTGFPSIRLAILVCGFLPTAKDPTVASLLPEVLHTPSIHILGEKDPFVAEGENLKQKYDSRLRRDFKHHQGHQFGTKREFNDQVAQAVVDLLDGAEARL